MTINGEMSEVVRFRNPSIFKTSSTFHCGDQSLDIVEC